MLNFPRACFVSQQLWVGHAPVFGVGTFPMLAQQTHVAPWQESYNRFEVLLSARTLVAEPIPHGHLWVVLFITTRISRPRQFTYSKPCVRYFVLPTLPSGTGDTMARQAVSETGCANHVNYQLNPNSARVSGPSWRQTAQVVAVKRQTRTIWNFLVKHLVRQSAAGHSSTYVACIAVSSCNQTNANVKVSNLF